MTEVTYYVALLITSRMTTINRLSVKMVIM